MATNENAPHTAAWVQGATARKYGTHAGLPTVSTEFAELGRGFIATVPAPLWFHHVPESERPFVAAAMLEMAQNRGGQNSDPKTAKEYSEAVAKAMNGAGESARVRDKDAMMNAARREVETKALAAEPDAPESVIKDTVDALCSEYLANHSDQLFAEGFMIPVKKTKSRGEPKRIVQGIK
jgi:hypothetical protein